MRPHVRREQPETQSVWCVIETKGNAADVIAVKATEGAANIAAKVQRARWPEADRWRVAVTGPHVVASDYI